MTGPVPAVIPAAGRSHRMGSPKALLDAGGVSFLGRILGSLRDGGAFPLVVVVRSPSGPVTEEAVRHGGEVVVNPDPTPGPVSSLQAGLRALPESVPAVLLAPVDHPLFSASTVRALIRAFSDTRAPVIVPAYDGWRGHPVLFSQALFPELLEPDLPEGARTVIRRYLDSRVQLAVDDPGILTDIDTPEEYDRHFPRSS